MFNDLSALGYGLVLFAVIIGVGTIILVRFGGATAGCDTGYTYDYTTEYCVEDANASHSVTPTAPSWTNTNYLSGQLGSGGLAGWTPAIIAVAIGVMFLGAFMIGKARSKRR